MLTCVIADLDAFNDILKKAKGKKYSWEDISKETGVSLSSIEAYRKGKRNPTTLSLQKLCDFLPREKRTELYNELFKCTKIYRDNEEDKIRLENEQHRKNGFKGLSIRSMYAAVCIQTCIDFRKARSGCATVDGRPADEVAEECLEFFRSPIFRSISGQSSVDYIVKCIMRTEPSELQYLWRQNELFRKKNRVVHAYTGPRDPKTGRFAKNTRPIIEGL